MVVPVVWMPEVKSRQASVYASSSPSTAFRLTGCISIKSGPTETVRGNASASITV